MAGDEWYPADPYLEHRDEPVARPARPISQGDIFLGLPIVRGTRWKKNQWKPNASVKPEGLSMLIAHPCSARSNETHRLKDDISLAPIVPRAKNWGPPWTGHYEMFPLPYLFRGSDYMADLSKAFPVIPEYLRGRRVACLNEDGLAALLDRLAKNSTRLEALHVPGHFQSEAERLRMEFDLWETWVKGTDTEDGFQDWIEGKWMPGATRREAMRGHFEEIRAAVAAEVGVELPPG